MSGMLSELRDATVARRLATLPPMTAAEHLAADIGRQDAARPGARLRQFLLVRPRLLKAVRMLFGISLENGLADARLEAVRVQALTMALVVSK
jgi:hypothetical protein